VSLFHLAAAAAVALAPAAPVTPDPVDVPDVVVAICVAVDLEEIDDILDGLPVDDIAELPAPLDALAPVTLDVGPTLGLDVTVSIGDIRALLACHLFVPTPAPTTTPTPTTDPVPTTTPAPTTTTAPPTTTVAPDDDGDENDDITQVRFVPVGGADTGDGSLAA
jgi:hypothetical protein